MIDAWRWSRPSSVSTGLHDSTNVKISRDLSAQEILSAGLSITFEIQGHPLKGPVSRNELLRTSLVISLVFSRQSEKTKKPRRDASINRGLGKQFVQNRIHLNVLRMAGRKCVLHTDGNKITLRMGRSIVKKPPRQRRHEIISVNSGRRGFRRSL